MTPGPSCDKSVLAVVCLVSEQHLTGNIYGCAHTIHTLVNLCNMGIEPMQCVTHINGIDMLVYVLYMVHCLSTSDHPCSYMYDTDTSEPNTVQLLCYTASHLCSRPSVLNVIPTREREKGGREKGDLSEKGKRGEKGKGMRRRGGMKHLLRFTSSPYNLSYFQDFHFLVKADGTMVMRVLSRHQQIYLLSYFTKYIFSISQILKLNLRIHIYQSN